MRGTADTAETLNLNIKTVQKYFGLLRDNLANLSQRSVLQQLGSEYVPTDWFDSFPQRSACSQSAKPLAAIVKTESGLSLLQTQPAASQPGFPEEIVLGWLYAHDEESRQRLNLDRIHCQSRDSNSIILATPFWRFIKQGLVHYQGGFRHNFLQYLREMEFRYNDREAQCGSDICLHYLTAE